MYVAGVFVLLALATAANLIGGKVGIGGGRPETWGITIALFAAALVVAGYAIRSRWDGVFIDRDNRISLSRFQLVLWTIVLISALLTAGLTNAVSPSDPAPLNIFIQREIWGLLGLGAFTAVAAPAIKDSKRNPAGAQSLAPPPGSTAMLVRDQKLSAAPLMDNRVLVKADPRDARWIDLIMGDYEGFAYVDVSKLQQLTFTLVLVAIYTMALSATMAAAGAIHRFPTVDPGFLALLAISHAAYLADKQIAAT
jgi:hypothetical protein